MRKEALMPYTILATAGADTGVLTEAMTSVISGGFTTLQSTIEQVLTLSVPASVAIIALCGGVRYALKKVRGVIASAA